MDEHAKLVAALKEVINDSSPDGVILIKRIPAICNDIRDIKNDQKWQKWLLTGMCGGVGLLALKSLGI